MKYILSIDLGTTALKLALIDETGVVIVGATREYDLLPPRPGYVECEPETYWHAFKDAVHYIVESMSCSAEQILGLGISAQGETLFFTNENMEPLCNAIVWMDGRAQEEAKILTRVFTDEECYQRTGQVAFDPCWPAAKILWMKRKRPEIFKKTKKFILIEDWLIHRLTGECVSEGSLLCSTAYWDIRTKQWWPEMLEYLEITPSQLPRIMEPGEKVAKLSERVAAELGLSREMWVCTGALDQAAGAIGAGNIKEGMFSENIGAALAICAPMNTPKFDPNRVIPLHYFAIPDMYMLHTFTTGGMAMRWFRDCFCENEKAVSRMTQEDAYDLMTLEAMLVEPGSEGLIALPHLNGSMAPDINPNAKGVFYGFTLTHKKSHFIRAIMESTAYLIRRNIEALEAAGIQVKEIRALGGGSRSALWNQIKSDVTGKHLSTCSGSEAACLGIAILVGNAVGIFGSVEEGCEKMVRIKKRYMPIEENDVVYQEGYHKFVRLFKHLTRMFDGK